MKKIIFNSIFFVLFLSACNCQNTKKRIIIISEYEKCKKYLSLISYHWQNDTMGNNGFRSIAVNRILDEYKDAIVGMNFDEFEYHLGMGHSDRKFFEGNNKIYIYYLSRIPQEIGLVVKERTLLWITVDIDTNCIIEIYKINQKSP